MTILLKSSEEIERMRRAGMVVHSILAELRSMVAPGVTTRMLDTKARELGEKAGVRPAFLGYPSPGGKGPSFPGVICASKNSAIVHGVPSDEPLQDGDIISIDYGCELDGYFGDSAVTIPVGTISVEAEHLLKITSESLERAIEQCRPGKRLGDVAAAVQDYVEAEGLQIVKEFVGHGIGTQMHEPPQVPNFGRPGVGRLLRPGMVLALEPMVTIGDPTSELAEDGWTASTKDGSLSAHFEHTVAITENGPYVLSRP